MEQVTEYVTKVTTSGHLPDVVSEASKMVNFASVANIDFQSVINTWMPQITAQLFDTFGK
jgi:hypothetical protein